MSAHQVSLYQSGSRYRRVRFSLSTLRSASMLFEILWFQGYARFQKYEFETDENVATSWPLAKSWRESLPPELHMFAGNFLGQSYKNDAMPFSFQFGLTPKVELAPLPNGKEPASKTPVSICARGHSYSFATEFSHAGFQLTYYNDTEYAMRLIGDAFSVPVVEQLLFRLKELFDPAEEQQCKELYSNWQYPYKWVAPEASEVAIEEDDDDDDDYI